MSTDTTLVMLQYKEKKQGYDRTIWVNLRKKDYATLDIKDNDKLNWNTAPTFCTTENHQFRYQYFNLHTSWYTAY